VGNRGRNVWRTMAFASFPFLHIEVPAQRSSASIFHAPEYETHVDTSKFLKHRVGLMIKWHFIFLLTDIVMSFACLRFFLGYIMFTLL
jgi:hypothetical protein